MFHIYPLTDLTKQKLHGIVFDVKIYFKFKRNHESTASHHKHPVCQFHGDDTVNSTVLSFEEDTLGPN